VNIRDRGLQFSNVCHVLMAMNMAVSPLAGCAALDAEPARSWKRAHHLDLARPEQILGIDSRDLL
jgi:hypothetical protein